MDRVYFETGKIVHLLRDGSPNDRAAQALCGRSPWPGYWYGTGTQDEEDNAKTLPICVSCRDKLKG